MRLKFLSVLSLVCAASLGAPLIAEPAWSYATEGDVHVAQARGSNNIQAIVSLRNDRSEALLFVVGIWRSRPLSLRLSVEYANGRRVPLDTYRFAEIIDLRGTRAYKLELKRRDLRPLKSGDILVIEDLQRRAEVPLSGSSKAISTAEAFAGQDG